MTPFEEKYRLLKTDKQKKEFQGPEIKKLLKHLNDLRSFLPIELHPFVDTLETIKVIYKISHAKSVDKNHKIITAGFKEKWIWH